jgi:nucleoside phosphorylase
MCGICAGVKGKVQIGDVLFADPSWDFQSGKRVSGDASFSISPHQLDTHALIRSHVEQLRADQGALAKIAAEYDGKAPNLTRIVIGPVASGSAVLADGTVIEEIKNSQHRELIGVEMEIYGLYAAAASSSMPQPLAFAMKGVCDYGDSNKDDLNQHYAAYASANVLRLLVEKFGTKILSATSPE